MKNLLLMFVFGLILSGCDAGNLGVYWYPQASKVTAERGSGPLAGLEVVGYLPAYKIPALDIRQVRHLTDLVYFSFAPRSDGTLYQGVLTDQHRTFLRTVREQYGTKVLAGVTDHGSEGALAKIAGDPVLRSRFAAVLTALIVTEHLDGADFDWEYPNSQLLGDYAALLQEVHQRFVPQGFKLTVAVSPGKSLTSEAYEAVDRVHSMLYDDYGQHSTLENTAVHLQVMLREGVPAEKLLMGIPFYGRGYTESGPAWSSSVSYKTLRGRYRLSPGQDTVSGYYFNGINTIRKKVQLAKNAGLSGVVIWEIGQDTSDSTSLLGTITEARQELEHAN